MSNTITTYPTDVSNIKPQDQAIASTEQQKIVEKSFANKEFDTKTFLIFLACFLVIYFAIFSGVVIYQNKQMLKEDELYKEQSYQQMKRLNRTRSSFNSAY